MSDTHVDVPHDPLRDVVLLSSTINSRQVVSTAMVSNSANTRFSPRSLLSAKFVIWRGPLIRRRLGYWTRGRLRMTWRTVCGTRWSGRGGKATTTGCKKPKQKNWCFQHHQKMLKFRTEIMTRKCMCTKAGSTRMTKRPRFSLVRRVNNTSLWKLGTIWMYIEV